MKLGTVALAAAMLVIVFPGSVRARTGGEVLRVYGVESWQSQELYCQSSHSLDACRKELEVLKQVMQRYPLGRLGAWKWVLVRADQWRDLTGGLGLDPDSPAFTSLEDRVIVLNETLISRDPRYQRQLMEGFRMPMDRLLDLAIAHELGHALCGVTGELEAAAAGAELQRGALPSCLARLRSGSPGRHLMPDYLERI